MDLYINSCEGPVFDVVAQARFYRAAQRDAEEWWKRSPEQIDIQSNGKVQVINYGCHFRNI